MTSSFAPAFIKAGAKKTWRKYTERGELAELIARRGEKSPPVRRDCISLSADENGEPQRTDLRIREAYRVGPRTVERTRERFVTDSFEIAVHGKKREIFREKILDGEVEARLIALRCADPPSGYAKWTLELLADRMVELSKYPPVKPAALN